MLPIKKIHYVKGTVTDAMGSLNCVRGGPCRKKLIVQDNTCYSLQPVSLQLTCISKKTKTE